MFACSLEFCRTLKIITRILREVVNRVRLCGHHTVRCSHVEVQSRVVVRRRGSGGDERRDEAKHGYIHAKQN